MTAKKIYSNFISLLGAPQAQVEITEEHAKVALKAGNQLFHKWLINLSIYIHPFSTVTNLSAKNTAHTPFYSGLNRKSGRDYNYGIQGK